MFASNQKTLIHFFISVAQPKPKPQPKPQATHIDAHAILAHCPTTMNCMTSCKEGYTLGGTDAHGCPSCTCAKIQKSKLMIKYIKISLIVLYKYTYKYVYINLHWNYAIDHRYFRHYIIFNLFFFCVKLTTATPDVTNQSQQWLSKHVTQQ
jgi:hypothetical protein